MIQHRETALHVHRRQPAGVRLYLPFPQGEANALPLIHTCLGRHLETAQFQLFRKMRRRVTSHKLRCLSVQFLQAREHPHRCGENHQQDAQKPRHIAADTPVAQVGSRPALAKRRRRQLRFQQRRERRRLRRIALPVRRPQSPTLMPANKAQHLSFPLLPTERLPAVPIRHTPHTLSPPPQLHRLIPHVHLLLAEQKEEDRPRYHTTQQHGQDKIRPHVRTAIPHHPQQQRPRPRQNHPPHIRGAMAQRLIPKNNRVTHNARLSHPGSTRQGRSGGEGLYVQ